MSEPVAIANVDLALAVARGIADRHPGPQYDHIVKGTVIEIHAKHPQHGWAVGIDTSNPNAENPVKRGQFLAMQHFIDVWTSHLGMALRTTKVTNANATDMKQEDGITAVIDICRKAKATHKKIMFVGNGGSAAIASHMAEDFTKNGMLRATAFNDAALLTCFANDYGWDDVFSQCVAQYGVPGDVLIAISSSGKSQNIMDAVETSKAMAMTPITFSGFDETNPLRKMGQVNFYTPARQYGFVETAHAALLHMILDIHAGWVGQP